MILKTDPSQIQNYFSDCSSISGGYADGVVIPSSYTEISGFLKESSQKQTPVTISGGGTGTVGGRIPFGGFVLSTEALDKIIDIGDEFASLQSGTRLEDFQKAVNDAGLFYPPDSTDQFAAIGGNIATNASGARSYYFGATRKFVNKIKVALSTGKIIDIERGKIFADKHGRIQHEGINIVIPIYSMPDVKNAAGYYVKPGMDIIDLFIGSEGTLGVILEAEIRILKQPNCIFECVAFFKSENDAVNFIEDCRNYKNIFSIEYMDNNTLDLLRPDYHNIPKSSFAVLFEENCHVEPDFEKWLKLLEKNNCIIESIWIGQSPKDKKTIKEFRHRMPVVLNDFFSRSKFSKISTDTAVPASKLSDMIAIYRKILEENGLYYVVFGHIGQNHLHMNILPKTEDEFRKAKIAYLQCIKEVIKLGGTVSAEHGIGKLKKNYLEEMYGRSAVSDMANLKKKLDPACILGRGNIFDEALLQ